MSINPSEANRVEPSGVYCREFSSGRVFVFKSPDGGRDSVTTTTYSGFLTRYHENDFVADGLIPNSVLFDIDPYTPNYYTFVQGDTYASGLVLENNLSVASGLAGILGQNVTAISGSFIIPVTSIPQYSAERAKLQAYYNRYKLWWHYPYNTRYGQQYQEFYSTLWNHGVVNPWQFSGTIPMPVTIQPNSVVVSGNYAASTLSLAGIVSSVPSDFFRPTFTSGNITANLSYQFQAISYLNGYIDFDQIEYKETNAIYSQIQEHLGRVCDNRKVISWDSVDTTITDWSDTLQPARYNFSGILQGWEANNIQGGYNNIPLSIVGNHIEYIAFAGPQVEGNISYPRFPKNELLQLNHQNFEPDHFITPYENWSGMYFNNLLDEVSGYGEFYTHIPYTGYSPDTDIMHQIMYPASFTDNYFFRKNQSIFLDLGRHGKIIALCDVGQARAYYGLMAQQDTNVSVLYGANTTPFATHRVIDHHTWSKFKKTANKVIYGQWYLETEYWFTRASLESPFVWCDGEHTEYLPYEFLYDDDAAVVHQSPGPPIVQNGITLWPWVISIVDCDETRQAILDSMKCATWRDGGYSKDTSDPDGVYINDIPFASSIELELIGYGHRTQVTDLGTAGWTSAIHYRVKVRGPKIQTTIYTYLIDTYTDTSESQYALAFIPQQLTSVSFSNLGISFSGQDQTSLLIPASGAVVGSERAPLPVSGLNTILSLSGVSIPIVRKQNEDRNILFDDDLTEDTSLKSKRFPYVVTSEPHNNNALNKVDAAWFWRPVLAASSKHVTGPPTPSGGEMGSLTLPILCTLYSGPLEWSKEITYWDAYPTNELDPGDNSTKVLTNSHHLMGLTINNTSLEPQTVNPGSGWLVTQGF